MTAALLSKSVRTVSEAGESLREKEISLAALRVEKIPDENSIKQALRIIKQLETVLRSEPIDLAITPEYSFDLHYGQERNYEPMPLVVHQIKDGFAIDPLRSHNAAKIIVENAQSLAKSYKANLFLATFYDPSGNESANTSALYINNEGKITGVKRKFLPPEGKFEVVRGNQILKVLPMICGEVWKNRDNIPGTNDFRAIPPDWVKENAPYDIFAHAMSQADVDFNSLAALVEQTPLPKDHYFPSEAWLRDAFGNYYGEYLKFLKPNAPILIADWGIAATFNKDLTPIKRYQDHGEYVVAKLDVSKLASTPSEVPNHTREP